MPRAANTGTGALRRNQACRQCRKRKLKCDAQRPHCGTCQKQWTAQISVPPPVGFAHPKEPNCTYDPVEGLVLAPDTVEDPSERVRLLEAQIIQLQAKLTEAHMESIRPSPPDKARSDSPQGQSKMSGVSSQPIYNNQSYDYSGYNGQAAGASSSATGQGGPNDPFNLGNPSRARRSSVSDSYAGHTGQSYHSHSQSPSMSGDQYVTSGYQSETRANYPSVTDEVVEQRLYHRTSTSASHPYQRDQPHISSIIKAERGDGFGTYNDIKIAAVDPFMSDTGVASVSRLGRQSRTREHSISLNPSPPFYDIMHSGWSRDLPPRQHMANYIEIFFRCDPCSSRMLHKPTLLTNLNYPPTHPDFPHPALLHAICATASRFTLHGRLDPMMSTMQLPPNGPPVRDKFAEFHASKTRAYVNQTMSNGQNIFDVFQACVILSWWFYSEGRWVEVWVQAGFQTRAVVPLALNYLGLVKRGPDGSEVKNPYLAPPRSNHEAETRRRAWWMSIMFDRIVSVGGWLHSVDERDLGTELPLTTAHYDAAIDIPSNPQTLHSENMYIRHPINYTDPYLLFLKSIMLFGRVTDYSVRMGIRAPLMAHGHGEGTSPVFHNLSPNATTTQFPQSQLPYSRQSQSHSHSQSHPHSHSHSYSQFHRSPSPGPPGSSNETKSDPRQAPGFQGLDRLVAVDFVNSFPPQYRNCLGVGEGADGMGMHLDTDLYMAHLVPHAATITLHSPWINFAEPESCPSVARCMEAARAILDKYYALRSTSFDITWLHPFVTICWYLAAVVQINLCKRLIEVGDVENEAACWGEINLLRDALMTYGRYAPIGTRQEKMLHPIMQEIINMTSQKQPLAVGLPLYPFSLDTLFQREEKKAAAAAAAAAAASGTLTGNGDGIDEAQLATEAIAPIPDVSFPEDTAMSDAPSISVPSLQGVSNGLWR